MSARAAVSDTSPAAWAACSWHSRCSWAAPSCAGPPGGSAGGGQRATGGQAGRRRGGGEVRGQRGGQLRQVERRGRGRGRLGRGRCRGGCGHAGVSCRVVQGGRQRGHAGGVVGGQRHVRHRVEAGRGDGVGVGRVVAHIGELDRQALPHTGAELGEQQIAVGGVGHPQPAPQPLGALLGGDEAGHPARFHPGGAVPVEADDRGTVDLAQRARGYPLEAGRGAARHPVGGDDALGDARLRRVGGGGGQRGVELERGHAGVSCPVGVRPGAGRGRGWPGSGAAPSSHRSRSNATRCPRGLTSSWDSRPDTADM
jgi:hypothetical protein